MHMRYEDTPHRTAVYGVLYIVPYSVFRYSGIVCSVSGFDSIRFDSRINSSAESVRDSCDDL